MSNTSALSMPDQGLADSLHVLGVKQRYTAVRQALGDLHAEFSALGHSPGHDLVRARLNRKHAALVAERNTLKAWLNEHGRRVSAGERADGVTITEYTVRIYQQPDGRRDVRLYRRWPGGRLEPLCDIDDVGSWAEAVREAGLALHEYADEGEA